MKKILLVLVIICIASAGGYYLFRKHSSDKRIHIEEVFWRGRKALESNDDVNAFKLLSTAQQQAPDNPEFNLWAGIAAKKLGKNEQAYSFFENSWNKGKKEPVVFLNMIATSALPKREKILAFEEMATEIADEKSRLELTALLKFQRENLEEAAKLMQKLVSIYPEGVYGEFYAQILLRLKEPEAAVIMLERIRKEGKMNAACYIILSELYFAIDETQKAAELYAEAETRGMNTTEVIQHYGESLFYYGNNSESRSVLEKIQLPRMFEISDISSAAIFLQELRKETPLSKQLLTGAAQSFKDLIKNDSGELNRFTRQRFLEQACTMLNNFCLQTKEIHTQPAIPAEDIPAYRQKFLQTAQTLVAGFPDSLKLPENNRTTHRARIILMMLDSAEGDSDGIKNLLQLADGSSRWLEGERYFGKYLEETLAPTPDPVRQTEYFDIAAELLNDNITIQLNLADNLANQGKFQDSLVLFDRLTSNRIILARSPLVQFMRSKVLINSGEKLEGERILINLLRRGFITEQLLVNLGEVALDLQDTQATNMVLQTIKSHTTNHPQLRLLAANIYSLKREPKKTEEELSKLLDTTTDQNLREQAIMAKARLQSRNNMNEEALQTLSVIQTNSTQKEILKAEILNKLGKNIEAQAIFAKLQEIPPTARSLYAAILAGNGELQKAQQQLEEILKEDPQNSEALLNLALLFNGQGKNKEALNAIEQVVDNNPDDIRANTLLAQLLLTTGRARDAANLALKVLSLSPTNPVALQLLTAAYVTSGEYPKAIKAADKALQILKDNEFILLQKATALTELSKVVDQISPDLADKKAPISEKTEKEELADEVTALTSDIVFSGALSTLSNNAVQSEDNTNTAMRDFLDGRDSKKLREEAITILKTIKNQDAATVLLLEAELLQGRIPQVRQTLQSGLLKVNELFTLGVIADRMKLWNISATAYAEAFRLQPTNPVILNNYASAVVLAELPVDTETRELLLKAAADLPQLFAGDIKAVNTAAMVFNYFHKWPETINLARSYPALFKQDPDLSQLLDKARKEQKKTESASSTTNSPQTQRETKSSKENAEDENQPADRKSS